MAERGTRNVRFRQVGGDQETLWCRDLKGRLRKGQLQ